MSTVTVYRFASWHQGRPITADRMATREAIRKLRGEAYLESAREVPASEVDQAGFHTPGAQQTAGVVRF